MELASGSQRGSLQTRCLIMYISNTIASFRAQAQTMLAVSRSRANPPRLHPGAVRSRRSPATNIWIRSNSITGFGELVNSTATAGAITVINSTAATIVRPTSGDVVGDYRWLPNGMKVIIGGAGAQGSDLRARVLANNGSELTLDTSAATQQAAASLTYQPLSLS